MARHVLMLLHEVQERTAQEAVLMSKRQQLVRKHLPECAVLLLILIAEAVSYAAAAGDVHQGAYS